MSINEIKFSDEERLKSQFALNVKYEEVLSLLDEIAKYAINDYDNVTITMSIIEKGATVKFTWKEFPFPPIARTVFFFKRITLNACESFDMFSDKAFEFDTDTVNATGKHPSQIRVHISKEKVEKIDWKDFPEMKKSILKEIVFEELKK